MDDQEERCKNACKQASSFLLKAKSVFRIPPAPIPKKEANAHITTPAASQAAQTLRDGL